MPSVNNCTIGFQHSGVLVFDACCFKVFFMICLCGIFGCLKEKNVSIYVLGHSKGIICSVTNFQLNEWCICFEKVFCISMTSKEGGKLSKQILYYKNNSN